MKEEKNNVNLFDVYGKSIEIDYDKGIVTFPEGCTKTEMGQICVYLHREGFLEAALNKTDTP